MFLVAWDGDEIAGGVLNAVYPQENLELGLNRGWLDSVFTRRAWRRRGLARNLIARSLHLLRERGLTDADPRRRRRQPVGRARPLRVGRLRRHRAVDGVATSARGGVVVTATVSTVPGLAIRGYRGEEDLPAMLLVYTAAHEADGVEEVETLDDMRRTYATLVNCDPDRDILLAEVDGEVVAYARVFWQELVEGGRSYENFGFVHPSWRRRGIGAVLHRLGEERLREIAAEHPDVEPKWLASESIDADAGCVALLRGDGYTAARFFYDMVARTLDGIVAHRCPTASSCAR